MTVNPRVSVIMPLYDCETYVRQAIDSILAQSYTGWELIVVDDGSTDQSAKIVAAAAVQDPRIRLILQANSGRPAVPKNVAFRSARGQYVCFLDQDDLYHPCKIASQVEVLERFPDIDLVFCQMKVFSGGDPEEGYSYLDRVNWQERVSSCLEKVEDDLYRCSGNFYRFMSTEVTSLTTQTVMVRRSTIQSEQGPFDEALWVSDDIDLWFRLASRCKIIYINRVLAYYRRHDNNVTADNEKALLGSITAHSKNLSRAKGILDDNALRIIHKRIGQNLFSLGYHYIKTQQFAEGRRCYLDAINCVGLSKIALAWLKSWVHQGVYAIGSLGKS